MFCSPILRPRLAYGALIWLAITASMPADAGARSVESPSHSPTRSTLVKKPIPEENFLVGNFLRRAKYSLTPTVALPKTAGLQVVKKIRAALVLATLGAAIVTAGCSTSGKEDKVDPFAVHIGHPGELYLARRPKDTSFLGSLFGKAREMPSFGEGAAGSVVGDLVRNWPKSIVVPGGGVNVAYHRVAGNKRGQINVYLLPHAVETPHRSRRYSSKQSIKRHALAAFYLDPTSRSGTFKSLRGSGPDNANGHQTLEAFHGLLSLLRGRLDVVHASFSDADAAFLKLAQQMAKRRGYTVETVFDRKSSDRKSSYTRIKLTYQRQVKKPKLDEGNTPVVR